MDRLRRLASMLLVGVANVVGVVYSAGTLLVFTPYYNYLHFKEKGFVSWLMLGQIEASLKAAAWPYFVFIAKSEPYAVNSSTKIDWPALSPDESARLQPFYESMMSKPVTLAEVDSARTVYEEYFQRVGRRYNRDETKQFIRMISYANDYHDELYNSWLLSWDAKAVVTTKHFDALSREVAKARKRELIDQDMACLQAAAENQEWFESSGGQRHAFGRTFIAERIEENRVAKSNLRQFEEALLSLCKD